MKTAASLAVLSTASLTGAWSINGHLYVANIAERLLAENAPEKLDKAYRLLDALTEFKPEFTWREDEHALVECSTFADDWKYRGEAWQGLFHYTNIPWIDVGNDNEAYSVTMKTKNIVSGSNHIIAWLSNRQGDDYKDSYIYEFLVERKFPGNEEVARSYALRMLVHLIGDIAQPFHSMTRYTPDYISGDVGANAFKLPYRYGVKNLHSLWDKVLYEERNNIRRPFTQDSWNSFQVKVDKVMADHADAVADPAVYESVDMQDWSDDAWELSKTLYSGLVENEPVPPEYLEKNIPIAYERILIGGYRLYYALDYIFTDEFDINQ